MKKMSLEQLLNRKQLKKFDYSSLNSDIQNQLQLIIDHYSYDFLHLRIINVITFIEYDVRDNWIDRLNKIKFIYGKDSSSFKSISTRYGEYNAEKIFNEKNKKCLITEKTFINKYGEEEGKIKWKELCEKKLFKQITYSKISQELFWEILDFIPTYKREDMWFAEFNEEFIFYAYTDKLNYFLTDFKMNDKIIEFDGDYWHSKSIEKDRLKDEFLISKGYKILRIKESEYLKDKEKIIIKCINFLNK